MRYVLMLFTTQYINTAYRFCITIGASTWWLTTSPKVNIYYIQHLPQSKKYQTNPE